VMGMVGKAITKTQEIKNSKTQDKSKTNKIKVKPVEEADVAD
jgi:hypothetical protein